VLFAQNGITLSGLVVTAGTATFDIRWNRDAMPVALWSDTVWVFVDYNNAGKMERLPLLPGATLTETSADGVGEVIEVSGNDKGVWVAGNARSAGSFSATVKLLTAIKDVGGACVYASNYPSVGEYTSATNISFAGTPPYDLTFEHEGSTFTLPSGSTYLLPANYTLLSFVDATGAPGIIQCLAPAPPTVVDATFCFGLPGQLQAATSGGATIVWYNAPTAGNLLSTGNVLPLTPLYNDTAQYYAEAVSETNCPSIRTAANYSVNHCVLNGYCPGFAAGNVLYAGNVLPLTPLYNDAAQYYAEAVSEKNCPSVRTAATYTINHCVINGYCPGFAAGNVGSGSAPEAACSAYDSGRIGLVNYQATCEVFYPGQIGSAAYPAACMSYDAGWIGKQN
jgi:hypothetical protein